MHPVARGWTRKTRTGFGAIICLFGLIITFASVSIILQLQQALDLCTSTLSCPGTLSGGSVYSNVYTALLWTGVTTALGLGTSVGGFILAYTALRSRSET